MWFANRVLTFFVFYQTIGYEWFEGLVLGYDEDTDEFEILYDDGKLAHLVVFLALNRPIKALASKKTWKCDSGVPVRAFSKRAS